MYILIFLVVGSFGTMCWLVYSERNLTEFISSYNRSEEVVTVNEGTVVEFVIKIT